MPFQDFWVLVFFYWFVISLMVWVCLSSYNPLWSDNVAFGGVEFWKQVESIPALKLSWFACALLGIGVWFWVGIVLEPKLSKLMEKMGVTADKMSVLSNLLVTVLSWSLSSAIQAHKYSSGMCFDYSAIGRRSTCLFSVSNYGRSLLIIFGIAIIFSSLSHLWLSLVREHQRTGFNPRFSRINSCVLLVSALSLPIGLFVTSRLILPDALYMISFYFTLAISMFGLTMGVVRAYWQQQKIVQTYRASLPGRIQP